MRYESPILREPQDGIGSKQSDATTGMRYEGIGSKQSDAMELKANS